MRKLLILAMAVLMVGCARVQPVQNLKHQPVPPHMTTYQVKKAIMNAGSIKKWHMTSVRPGLIRAVISVRKHMATANIHYSSKAYSIHYASSHNLMAAGGQVHRNYNKWIILLNSKIRHQLAMMASKRK